MGIEIMQKKQDFPFFSHHKNLTYLDSASTAQKPQSVIDAVCEYYTRMNANVGRGVYTLAEQVTTRYEKVRAQVAAFIGAASAQEIIFTKGTTEGINFIASTWGYDHVCEGDEIVVTELEHHSNFVPWQRLAQQKKALLKIIPITQSGDLAFKSMADWITPKTKIVAVTHVSNALGIGNAHLNAIIKAAHAVGAKVLVDGCQAIGYQEVNVRDLGCDFYVFSGHKLYGPTGIGVLYIKQSVQKEVKPYQFGGGAVFEVKHSDTVVREAPYCYEAGTPAIAQVFGLGAALEYVFTIGVHVIQKHVAALCAYTIEGLQGLSRVTILGDVEYLKLNGHVVSFLVEGIHAHDVAAFLDSQGICVRAGHHCAQLIARSLGYDSSVRVSFAVYNNAHDVDLLLGALRQLCASE